MSSKTLQRAADDMQIVRIPKGGGPNVKWDLSDDIKKMLADDDGPAIEAKAKQMAKAIEDKGDEATDEEKAELDAFLAEVLEEDEKKGDKSSWLEDSLADVDAMVDWVDEVIKVIDATDLTDVEKLRRLKELRKEVEE